jgi:hypothetical protein
LAKKPQFTPPPLTVITNSTEKTIGKKYEFTGKIRIFRQKLATFYWFWLLPTSTSCIRSLTIKRYKPSSTHQDGEKRTGVSNLILYSLAIRQKKKERQKNKRKLSVQRYEFS